MAADGIPILDPVCDFLEEQIEHFDLNYARVFIFVGIIKIKHAWDLITLHFSR